ncbi:hypothetical protein D9619_008181 [Psilocybe cf. subviscida]|uniref:Anaphase-promoting complex subunit 4 WD40 domain-containing protein n=1 Tax=Psilocybe cf. subviscida TaxID=2480587 RepID=A0A8H5ESL5_9AGAR|nr:hypothetical protein D9619_008181 [Psilocybe cf. subviscida]
MKANYKFSNICGTVYRQGNILFTRDGNSLYSPVGNRVSVFDLVNNKSSTFAFESRKNIAAIALSPDGNVLISVDEDGRALLVNARRGVVLHHINFKKPVKDIQFSPDGQTPNHLLREFAPFTLHRTYTGHHDDVLSIQWAPDSSCFITTSRDMTARLFTLNPLEGFRPKTFAGHRDAVLSACFSADGETIYTVSKDGAVFTWKMKDDDDDNSDAEPVASTSRDTINRIARTRRGVHKRNYFNQAGVKVVCTTFHAASNLLVVGFSNGVFRLYEMPAFSNIHTLSVSHEKISSVAISPSGEWLAFGARKLGQLLIWEWQGVMVKRFQISENLSLDGTQEFLDSGKVNDAGINVDLIDDRDGSGLEDRLDTNLPGASRGAGDMSIRKFRQEARTKCVRFSPTGRAWAAASIGWNPFSVHLRPIRGAMGSNTTT